MTCPACATETEQHDARLHALNDKLEELRARMDRWGRWANKLHDRLPPEIVVPPQVWAALDAREDARRAEQPADVAGPNDIWQSVKRTASAVEKWPEWKKRSAGIAGPNDSTVSGSVAQLPNQPAESKSRAEVRDTSTGEGKPVDAGESPVAPSFQAGGQAPQLAIAPAGLEVRPQAVAPAAEGTEPPPPDGPLAPQSAPREESPAQTSGGGAGGQVYLAGPMDVPCVTCGRPAKSPCGAPSATLIDGFHRSRWDRVGRSPAEQPAPTAPVLDGPGLASLVERVTAQAAPTHLADCAIRIGTSRNCDCAKPAPMVTDVEEYDEACERASQAAPPGGYGTRGCAGCDGRIPVAQGRGKFCDRCLAKSQAAPDGGRLSERVRTCNGRGLNELADEVAIIEDELDKADQEHQDVTAKLETAERERDAAIEKLGKANTRMEELDRVPFLPSSCHLCGCVYGSFAEAQSHVCGKAAP